MTFGSIIKTIRLKKKMTQAQLSDGLISNQTLSNIERGVTSIPADVCFELLNRMNVSLEEFQLLLHSDFGHLDQNKFLENYDKAVKQQNVMFLKKLLHEQREKKMFSNNVHYTHNIILLKQRLRQFSGEDFNEEETKTISDYLFLCEDWFYYELILFKHAAFFLSENELLVHSKSAFKKASFMSILNTNKVLTATILMNITSEMLRKNNFSFVKRSLIQIEKLLQNSDDLKEVTRFWFLKGLYHVANENSEYGTHLCQKAIKVMMTFNKVDTAKAYQETLNKYLTNR